MQNQHLHRQFRNASQRHLLQRQVLTMMMGVPDSGKSYFSRQLAARLGMVRVNGDALRTEKFGHPEPRDRLPPAHLTAHSWRIMSLLEYRANAALRASFSVVRDHMHHYRHHQLDGKRMSDEVGALPIIVWIKTPYDLVKQRSLERELSYDQFPKRSPQHAQKQLEKWHREIDLPADDQRDVSLLEIDGRWPFEKQLKAFTEFVSQCDMKGPGVINSSLF